MKNLCIAFFSTVNMSSHIALMKRSFHICDFCSLARPGSHTLLLPVALCSLYRVLLTYTAWLWWNSTVTSSVIWSFRRKRGCMAHIWHFFLLISWCLGACLWAATVEFSIPLFNTLSLLAHDISNILYTNPQRFFLEYFPHPFLPGKLLALPMRWLTFSIILPVKE